VRREELTRKLAGFEAAHAVGDWTCGGWRVWPAVRAQLAMRHHDPEAAPPPRVPLDMLIDHFVHIAKVAGVDHVGIGSDFDGVGGQLPEGMEDVSKLPAITYELLKRGFSDADVKKVLGENFLRTMAEVERVAKSLQASGAKPSTAKIGSAPKN